MDVLKGSSKLQCIGGTSLSIRRLPPHLHIPAIMDTLSVAMLKPSSALEEATRALGSFINLGSDQDTLDIMNDLMFMRKTFSIKPTVAVFTAPKEKNLNTISEEDE
ncbi:hypothetical protein DYB25_000346 [Aphanomyces astaci]|uniref:Uncharacterized protein n=3 Tax=Aphanomyces astaci TaxID=112090 RepID=A0A397B7U7_APHAT|nr:hypothetical protein DYB25_000346 [Aphanomyces astaci]RHY38271.1 hypothetical protein DYB34_011510 [Aphanomyces astaci]RHY78481.1 hypothetical protein DYB38_000432 [Aphanomyces astaci]RHY83684.1 hypothetical protein DYB35_002504 [Aphanomyces astaci]